MSAKASPIKITCPRCSGRFTAPAAAAGRATKCPQCKEPIRVPGEMIDVQETVAETRAIEDKPIEELRQRKPKKPFGTTLRQVLGDMPAVFRGVVWLLVFVLIVWEYFAYQAAWNDPKISAIQQTALSTHYLVGMVFYFFFGAICDAFSRRKRG